MTANADRLRARYAELRAKNCCTQCGARLFSVGAVKSSRTRCAGCRRSAATYYQRRSTAAAARRIAADRARAAAIKGTAIAAQYRATARANRKLLVATTGCCIECSQPPAPRRERCIRHLQRARKRARARRAAERAARAAT